MSQNCYQKKPSRHGSPSLHMLCKVITEGIPERCINILYQVLSSLFCTTMAAHRRQKGCSNLFSAKTMPMRNTCWWANKLATFTNDNLHINCTLAVVYFEFSQSVPSRTTTPPTKTALKESLNCSHSCLILAWSSHKACHMLHKWLWLVRKGQ